MDSVADYHYSTLMVGQLGSTFKDDEGELVTGLVYLYQTVSFCSLDLLGCADTILAPKTSNNLNCF